MIYVMKPLSKFVVGIDNRRTRNDNVGVIAPGSGVHHSHCGVCIAVPVCKRGDFCAYTFWQIQGLPESVRCFFSFQFNTFVTTIAGYYHLQRVLGWYVLHKSHNTKNSVGVVRYSCAFQLSMPVSIWASIVWDRLRKLISGASGGVRQTDNKVTDFVSETPVDTGWKYELNCSANGNCLLFLDCSIYKDSRWW